MEQRSSQRRMIDIPIVCTRLTTLADDVTIEGRILNICSGGFYAELNSHVKDGTILLVRAINSSRGCCMDRGFKSLALAEVRWSQPKLVESDEVCYAVGLSYPNA